MRMEFLSLLFFYFFFIKVVYAQLLFPLEEIARAVMTALFGELPADCQYALSTPSCIKCLIYIKMFPFFFVFGLFFLLFFLVIEYMATPPGQQREDITKKPYYKGVVLMSIILSFFYVHFPGSLDYLAWWVTILVISAAILFIGGMFGRTGLGGMFALILIILLIVLIIPYIFNTIGGVVESWKMLCGVE